MMMTVGIMMMTVVIMRVTVIIMMVTVAIMLMSRRWSWRSRRRRRCILAGVSAVPTHAAHNTSAYRFRHMYKSVSAAMAALAQMTLGTMLMAMVMLTAMTATVFVMVAKSVMRATFD